MSSDGDAWIEWARRLAEKADGRPANPRATPAETATPCNPAGQPPATAYAVRQGDGERQGEPFPERQGNTEHGAPGGGESDPRRPGDPPWRGRTARRTSTPDAMAAFRDARTRRGWTLTRAARETGVSRPHLSLLERGLRRPSESVAEAIITGYKMTPAEADAVTEISVPWAGRDSPHKTGVSPEPW